MRERRQTTGWLAKLARPRSRMCRTFPKLTKSTSTIAIAIANANAIAIARDFSELTIRLLFLSSVCNSYFDTVRLKQLLTARCKLFSVSLQLFQALNLKSQNCELRGAH